MNEKIVVLYEDVPYDVLMQLIEDFIDEFDDHVERVKDVLDKNDVEYSVVTEDV